MATKINIAQLDIDIDGLKSSMVEAKTELDRLVASNREMRKAGDSANQTYIEQDAAIKRLRSEYNSQARVLNQAIVAIEGADKAYNAQIKTVSQAEQANKTLRQAIKHLDTTTVEGIATAEKYNTRIEENTAFMKDNVDEQIQGYMSVGEYSKGIQDAAAELNPFNMLLKGMNGGFKEAGGILPFVTQSLKGVVGGIRAATTASLAFIATPVGAVIAAIGLVLALVINYLKNAESGMDKVMSVLRPLNEVLKVFWEVLENVGKALVDAFSNPTESIKALGNLIGKVLVGYVKTAMRYFTNLGKIMLGAVTFDKSMIQEGWDDMKALAEETKDAVVDGFNKAKDKVSEFGDSLSEAAENGRRIHELTIAIRESTEELAASENDYKDALLEQEKIYKDRSQSEDARLKAAQAMRDLQEERSTQIQDQLTMEIERHRREIDAGETTHEQRMKLIELEKRLGDEKRKVGDFDVAQLSRINNIRERGERDRKKALDDQKKAQAEILRLAELTASVREAEAEIEKTADAIKRRDQERLAESLKSLAEDESLSNKDRLIFLKEWKELTEEIQKEDDKKLKSLRKEIDLVGKVSEAKLEEAEALQKSAQYNKKRQEDIVSGLQKELQANRDLIAEKKASREEDEKHAQNLYDKVEELRKARPEGSDFTDEMIALSNEYLELRRKLDAPDEDLGGIEETIKKQEEALESSIDVLEDRTEAYEKAAKDVLDIKKQENDLLLEEERLRLAILDRSIQSVDLEEKVNKDKSDNELALEEAKRKMREESTLLQQESEVERLAYERELRAAELERQLDEEEKFLIEKMDLLNLSEEEKTALLAEHAELRREVMSDLEEQWREEDKQNIDDYEAYKRSANRETTNLIKEHFKEKTAMGKALTVAQKAFALQEWYIQKKKAIAEQALNKTTATGELAKGQAKTAAAAPFPANIPLILGFVAQAAGILAMFKPPKIKDPKFAKGTILGGPRHFEGGIKTPFGEVEGGEMLLTRGVTFDPILRSMASQLNMMGGGDRLDTGSSVGSVGQPKGFVDYDKLAAKVAQANRYLPSPLVRVSDIDRVQDSVKVIDDLTTF